MFKAPVSRAIALTSTLGSIAAAGLFAAAPAHAATIAYLPDNCGYSFSQFFNGDDCYGGLFLYYHQNGGGAMADFVGNVINYSADPCGSYVCDYVFYAQAGTSTDGLNQGVRNDAGSVYNTSSQLTYTVYYHPDYTGHSQSFGPNSRTFINLDSTLHNNNASQSAHN